MMEYKPFDPETTPQNRLLIICWPDGEYDIAKFKKFGDNYLWVLKSERWYGSKNILWCELPLVEKAQKGQHI